MRWGMIAVLGLVIALGAQGALAETFSGEVTRVDRGAKAIVVRGGEPLRKKKFFLARGAELTSGGAASSLGELKPGARVEVTYTESRSYLFARRVSVVGDDAAAAGAQ